MTLREILSLLKNVKRSGAGYVASCPAHADDKQSLSVCENGEKILVNCFRGCPTEEICAALRIELKDLFLNSRSNGFKSPSTTKPKRQPNIIKGEEICAYDYRDEKGNLLYQNVRFWETFDDGSEDKSFKARRFVNGREMWNLRDVRRVPYRLPELLAALQDKPNRWVILTEGEKDADNLRALDFVASSFKNWRADFNSFVTGANVILLIDHDSPGVKWANDALQIISKATRSIKVIDLFDDEPLPEKHGKDVSDWLESHCRDDLQEIITQAPLWNPKDEAEAQQKSETSEKPLTIIKASEVVPTTIKWLWFPYIPLGYVTLFAGEEGVGKSWVFCAIASGISNGFLPLTERFDPKNVLIFSAEDRADDAIVPRLVKCGANLERISIVNEKFTFDEKGLRKFEQCIVESNAVWVIIDPLFAYSDLRLDLNKPHHARYLASGFEQIAYKHSISISYLIHFNKSKGGGDARAAVSSSQEFSNAARSILLIGKDAKDETRRALIHRKHNHSGKGKAIGYTIKGGNEDVIFLWLGESNLTEREIVSHTGSEEERDEHLEAVAFLRETLATGEREAKDVEKEADKLGITSRQLRTARTKIGITIQSGCIRREGFGKDSKNFWRLPAIDDKTASETSIDDAKNEKSHLWANGLNKTSSDNNFTIDDANHFSGHLWSEKHPKKSSMNGQPERCWQPACGALVSREDSHCPNCGEALDIPF